MDSAPSISTSASQGQPAPPLLTSSITNESSDTDFTDLTSIKTPGSSILLQTDSPSDSRQSPRREQQDILSQYKRASLEPPDVTEEMEKWFSQADRYGFLDHEDVLMPEVSRKESERSVKWARMAKQRLLHGDSVHAFPYSRKFSKRVYKGIPDCWRRDAWYYMCTDGLRAAEQDNTLRQQYTRLLLQSNPHERQIDLDIPRTMNGHIMFRQRFGTGQRALFSVLRAFASFDQEVGYCQGMTNVVAMLLLYCEEEKAFEILVHIFRRDGLHYLYIPGFPALMESFYIQERLIQKYLPRLYRHLHDTGLSSDAYATRWYITLFTGGVVPYHTLVRIWDIYFLIGYDIFYFVALALLQTHQEKLLAGDLDVCMQILGSVMHVPDDDQFIKLVKKLYDRNRLQRTLHHYKAEYNSQKLLPPLPCD